jgi:hypothetical protein
VVVDIDVRLAMRCTALLEEGQALEGCADFKGAQAKYADMKSLGAHFQDRDMGASVAEGAQDAIDALPSVPLPPPGHPAAALGLGLAAAADDDDNATGGGEEDGAAAVAATAAAVPVPAWATYEATSSLAFAKDMDQRVALRTAQAEAAAAAVAGTAGAVAAGEAAAASEEEAAAALLLAAAAAASVRAQRELQAAALLLEAELSARRAAWLEGHTKLEANKKDPAKVNARCGFPWCGKLFRDGAFAAKHLVAKHAPHLAAELQPLRRAAMRARFAADPAPPLPLLEVAEAAAAAGFGANPRAHVVTVDPLDVLRGQFLAPPPPPPPPPPPRPLPTPAPLLAGPPPGFGFGPPGFGPPAYSAGGGGGGGGGWESGGARGGGGGGPAKRGLPPNAVRVTYDDVDAPKGGKVVVEYADEASLGAPPPKKRKKKGSTPKKKGHVVAAASGDHDPDSTPAAAEEEEAAPEEVAAYAEDE